MSDYIYHKIMKYCRDGKKVIARQKREIAQLKELIELRKQIDEMKEGKKNDK